MRKKLLASAFGMIVIVLLIVAGNQVIIRLFSGFSNKLIVEYHELHSLQELKVSLSTTSTFLSVSHGMTSDFSEGFNRSLSESNADFQRCQEVLTEVHRGQSWEHVKKDYAQIAMLGSEFLKSGSGEKFQLSIELIRLIRHVVDNIDLMVNETLEEIKVYQHRNKMVVQHGSMTILIFGIGLIIILAAGSWRFIKNLTSPIDQLVASMKRIEQGDTPLKIEVDSDDEFKYLADSFNSMLEVLNATTVSETFLSNVLNNLFGALVVTNPDGKIRFINETVCRTLEYSKEELIGADSHTLFNISFVELDEEKDNLENYASNLVKATEMKSKNGKLIPAYVTCTILKGTDELPSGMVVVGHDLTEEKKYEEKLERIRKARLMAINEAQENERIRFAKDLHDGLGQILTGISYSLQSLHPSNSEEEKVLEQLDLQIGTAIQEAKNIAYNLTSVILKDFGLVPALENLVMKTNQLKQTQFLFNSYSCDSRIDPRLEKALYRICQECINNIIKHAEASSASIELFRKTDQIVLVIEDDGKGFNLDEVNLDQPSGIGLLSMRERAYVFDGLFSIDSKPGEGTEVLVEIPCHSNVLDHG